jgi:flagellar protein FlaJ
MFGPAEATSGEAHTVPERKPAKGSGGAVLTGYRAFCYRVLGERLDRSMTSELVADRLKQAGVTSSPGMHYAVIGVTTLVTLTASLAGSLLVFLLLLHIPTWYVYVVFLTGTSTGGVFVAFQFLVSSRISNRRTQLDKELPFTLSELSVLASTGMSPIELVRRMARRGHDPVMTSEFQRVVYKTDIQGKDLITALAETAKESPSNSLREAFWDLANMIHQGGNLDEYLRAKSDDVLKLKRVIQKEFIERLQTFVDMYISLVLVGVLMIAVGAFLLNAFESTAAGFDANELLLVLTYGIVPLSVAMTAILITLAYARAE